MFQKLYISIQTSYRIYPIISWSIKVFINFKKDPWDKR